MLLSRLRRYPFNYRFLRSGFNIFNRSYITQDELDYLYSMKEYQEANSYFSDKKYEECQLVSQKLISLLELAHGKNTKLQIPVRKLMTFSKLLTSGITYGDIGSEFSTFKDWMLKNLYNTEPLNTIIELENMHRILTTLETPVIAKDYIDELIDLLVNNKQIGFSFRIQKDNLLIYLYSQKAYIYSMIGDTADLIVAKTYYEKSIHLLQEYKTEDFYSEISPLLKNNLAVVGGWYILYTHKDFCRTHNENELSKDYLDKKEEEFKGIIQLFCESIDELENYKDKMTKKKLNRESLNFIEYLSWEGIVEHSKIEEEVSITQEVESEIVTNYDTLVPLGNLGEFVFKKNPYLATLFIKIVVNSYNRFEALPSIILKYSLLIAKRTNAIDYFEENINSYSEGETINRAKGYLVLLYIEVLHEQDPEHPKIKELLDIITEYDVEFNVRGLNNTYQWLNLFCSKADISFVANFEESVI